MKRQGSNRREFIKQVGLAGAGAMILPACAPGSVPTPAPSPPATPTGTPTVQPGLHVRKNIASLDASAGALDALRAGVAAMKARPESDPKSWAAQANIHLNFCPHGNWFFLPWHRAYLNYFELICREASGDDTFALPYWDWTAQPQVPAPFWGTNSPLFDSSRQIGPGDTASPEFVGPAVIDTIMNTSDFLAFGSGAATQQRQNSGYGILEGRPHNYVHGWIGGNMGTFLSPLDPIFWLHHCNVDRLWAEWNQTHANTSEPGWLAFQFADNFTDLQGDLATIAVKQTLSTPALGYHYDTLQAVSPRAARPTFAEGRFEVTAANSTPAAAGAPLSVELAPGSALRERMNALAGGADARETLRLTVEGLEAPSVPTVVRVFVNCDYLKADTPINDPHYVGSFTFFEHKGPGGEVHAEHAGPRTFLLDAAPALRKLKQSDGYSETGPLQVQFVPVPLREPTRRSTQRITPTKVRLSSVR